MTWFGSTLSQRLSLVFALLLLACSGFSVWVQLRATDRSEQETVQRLSSGLAAHIVDNAPLLKGGRVNPEAMQSLFQQLMVVNPSVEVYLVGLDGRIEAEAAPPGRVRLSRIDLAPVKKLLAGAPLPIFGDDPRHPDQRTVFSAAALRVDGRAMGYVYVVLLGEAHEALAASARTSSVLRTSSWAIALVALLTLLAGLAAFHLITKPLRALTAAVQRFERDGVASVDDATQAFGHASRRGGQEISALSQAFSQMARRMADQWRTLSAQDQQRRELFANLSHDLRTPLTALHGYLETLSIKSEVLDASERRRYLDIALGQSRKVGRLAQELFELARLEYGVVKPIKESFALPDLVQDLFQKFELAAEARQQRLVADIAPDLPVVTADLGMIERVLTNLIDNAIRHTPQGGEIVVQLRRDDGHEGVGVRVEVSDTGPGFSDDARGALFTRPVFSTGGRDGGLGLMIVQRMLQLHDSEIRLVQQNGKGAVFTFQLT